MLRKLLRLIFVVGIIPAVVLANTPGSNGTGPINHGQNSLPQSPTPKRLSASDLKKLRWIEGTWRGTGDVESPFFERYYFESDSVLVVESFSDETLSKVNDVTRFELREGQFGNWGEGARWVATQVDKRSITFEPVVKARNKFRWEKQAKDEWRAVLSWPSTGSGPAKQREYRMRRWRQPNR